MSGPCADRLEVLGAWLDGEASAAEVAELERHVQVCEGCREASRMLADLGSSVAHQPTLAPPADFAARTARAVVPAAGGFAWLRFASPLSARSASVGMALAELLDRQPRGRPGPAQVMLLFGLPALLLGLWNPSVPAWFLKIAAVCLLVGLPLHHWQARVARLGSLQRGRALEEILQTGVSRAQLLDALAVAGLGRLAWAGLGLVPLLCLADVRAGLLWLPALLAVAWLGSYPAACWSLGGGWRLGVVAGLGAVGLVFGGPSALQTLGWLGPDKDTAGNELGLPVEGARETFIWAHGQALRWICGLVMLGICLLLCRALALRLLERGPSRTRRSRNRWLLGDSEFPLVMRENVRRASRAPRGLAGVTLLYLPLPLLSAALAGSLTQDVESGWTWTLLVLITVGIVARAALRTLGAVLQEREQGLLQTGAIGPNFIGEWVKVTVSEAGLAFLSLWALPLVAVALTPREPLDRLEESLLSAPILTALLALALGMTAVAALLGLALSARSRTLGEARASLLAWGFGWLAAILTSLATFKLFVRDSDPVALQVAMSGGGALTAFWSLVVLQKALRLPVAAPVGASLGGRLAVCSGAAGATLGLVVNSWPRLPEPWAWDLVPLQVAAGFGLGWMAGRLWAWLVGPILRVEGVSRLQSWLITVGWAASFGLGVGLLRLLLTCLELLPFEHWAFDQIALATTASLVTAAVLWKVGPATDQACRLPLARVLTVSIIRSSLALAVLVLCLHWEFHLAPVDPEPILQQVRARRLASRQLPPPAARLEKLLRGDWPAGASAPYLNPKTLTPRVAEVAEAIRRGEFPSGDPTRPLAMDPDLLAGVAYSLTDLGTAKQSFHHLLLAVEWSARSRNLKYARTALGELQKWLAQKELTSAELRELLARTEGLDRLDLLPSFDEQFADSLSRLDAMRAYYDLPEAYWRRQRQVLATVYLQLRPLCANLDRSVDELEEKALERCAPCSLARSAILQSRWGSYATRVSDEREARLVLADVRARAQQQLEASK